jgi:hypothetical protein
MGTRTVNPGILSLSQAEPKPSPRPLFRPGRGEPLDESFLPLLPGREKRAGVMRAPRGYSTISSNNP